MSAAVTREILRELIYLTAATPVYRDFEQLQPKSGNLRRQFFKAANYQLLYKLATYVWPITRYQSVIRERYSQSVEHCVSTILFNSQQLLASDLPNKIKVVKALNKSFCRLAKNNNPFHRRSPVEHRMDQLKREAKARFKESSYRRMTREPNGPKITQKTAAKNHISKEFVSDAIAQATDQTTLEGMKMSKATKDQPGNEGSDERAFALFFKHFQTAVLNLFQRIADWFGKFGNQEIKDPRSTGILQTKLSTPKPYSEQYNAGQFTTEVINLGSGKGAVQYDNHLGGAPNPPQTKPSTLIPVGKT